MSVKRVKRNLAPAALVLAGLAALPAVAQARVVAGADLATAALPPVASADQQQGAEGALALRNIVVAGESGLPRSGRDFSVFGYRRALPQDVTASAAPQAARVVSVRAGDGFDWADAGIGAGAAFSASLLGAGAWRLRRRGHTGLVRA